MKIPFYYQLWISLAISAFLLLLSMIKAKSVSPEAPTVSKKTTTAPRPPQQPNVKRPIPATKKPLPATKKSVPITKQPSPATSHSFEDLSKELQETIEEGGEKIRSDLKGN